MNSEVKTNTGKYIDGELQGEALLQFEKLLKTDADLQEEVRFQKEIFTALKAKSEFEAEKEEVISFLEGLEKKVDLSNIEDEKPEIIAAEKQTKIEPTSQTVTQPTILRKLLPFATLAAAAAVLLFVLAPWKSNLTGSQLANQNFQTFSLESLRSSTDSQSILEKAKKAYTQNEFQLAITTFEDYLKENPKSPDIWLAKGSSEYKLDKLDNAILSFQEAQKRNPDYKPLAHWYLALCHLKKEDKTKAKSFLNKIMKGEENYEEAQKLLKTLK